MLLAGLSAGVLYGQAPQASSPASTGGNGSLNGVATAPAGVHPSSTGADSAARSQTSGPRSHRSNRTPGSGNGSGTNGGGAGGARNSQPPAPADNGSLQVTGFPAANSSGTSDRPLLPITGVGNALGIPSGTPIVVRLRAAIDSGHAHNGDMIDANLNAPLGKLPAGTPVRLTVVQAAPAGVIASYGELSVQVVSVADHRVLSNTVTALGKPGAKELPDAAPSRGTEAVFSADQPLSLPAA